MNVNVNLGPKREREREYVTCCMAFRFPNYPKFPKEFCGAARARPFPYACRGSRPAERPGRRESRGIRPRGEGQGGSTAGLVSPPACERFARNREAGFRRARRSPTRLLRGKSIAFDSAGEEGARRGGGPPPSRLRAVSALGAPERDRAGIGSAHPLRSTHPPTRVRACRVSYVCVSGSRTRPTLGEDYMYLQGCRAMIVLSGCTVVSLSEPCHELPGAGDGVCG